MQLAVGRSELGSFILVKRGWVVGGMGGDGQVPGGAGVSHRGFVQAGQHRDGGSKLVKTVIFREPKVTHKLA